MLIKFQKPDPRAGDVARMDSSRGQFFVDNGSAVRLNEDGSEEAGKDQSTVVTPTAGAKPSDGLKVDELKAALGVKGIQIPEGAKKQDLADLLDGAK